MADNKELRFVFRADEASARNVKRVVDDLAKSLKSSTENLSKIGGLVAGAGSAGRSSGNQGSNQFGNLPKILQDQSLGLTRFAAQSKDILQAMSRDVSKSIASEALEFGKLTGALNNAKKSYLDLSNAAETMRKSGGNEAQLINQAAKAYDKYADSLDKVNKKNQGIKNLQSQKEEIDDILSGKEQGSGSKGGFGISMKGAAVGAGVLGAVLATVADQAKFYQASKGAGDRNAIGMNNMANGMFQQARNGDFRDSYFWDQNKNAIKSEYGGQGAIGLSHLAGIGVNAAKWAGGVFAAGAVTGVGAIPGAIAGGIAGLGALGGGLYKEYQSWNRGDWDLEERQKMEEGLRNSEMHDPVSMAVFDQLSEMRTGRATAARRLGGMENVKNLFSQGAGLGMSFGETMGMASSLSASFGNEMLIGPKENGATGKYNYDGLFGRTASLARMGLDLNLVGQAIGGIGTNAYMRMNNRDSEMYNALGIGNTAVERALSYTSGNMDPGRDNAQLQNLISLTSGTKYGGALDSEMGGILGATVDKGDTVKQIQAIQSGVHALDGFGSNPFYTQMSQIGAMQILGGKGNGRQVRALSGASIQDLMQNTKLMSRLDISKEQRQAMLASRLTDIAANSMDVNGTDSISKAFKSGGIKGVLNSKEGRDMLATSLATSSAFGGDIDQADMALKFLDTGFQGKRADGKAFGSRKTINEAGADKVAEHVIEEAEKMKIAIWEKEVPKIVEHILAQTSKIMMKNLEDPNNKKSWNTAAGSELVVRVIGPR